MNKDDGSIIIGTKVDLSGIDKGIQEIDKKIKKLTDKAVIKNDTSASPEIISNLTKEEERYLKRLQQTREELEMQKVEALGLLDAQEKINEVVDNSALTSEKPTEVVSELTKKYNELMSYVEEYKELQKQQVLTDQEIENSEILKNNILLTAKELEKMTGQKFHIKGITDAVQDTQKINFNLTRIVKKVGHWALAIFGVRSAYSFVTNAMHTITQQDKQLQADIQLMKTALAYTIEPIVRRIVDFAKILMNYIAYIVRAWTGRDIFAEASKNLKSASKSAKELQKTSASFDKFNKLGATSSGGNGGVSSSIKGIDNNVPKWVQWIAKNKNLILGIGAGLLAMFGAGSIAKILRNIATLFGVSGGMGLIGLSELLLLIATPIVIAIAVKNVKNVINEIKELNKVLDDNVSNAKKSKDATQTIIEKYQNLIDENKLTNDQLKQYISYLKDSTERSTNFVKSLENQKTWWGELTGSNKKLNEQQQIHLERIRELTTAYGKLYEQNKLDKKGQEEYKKLLEETMTALGKQGKSVEDLQTQYKNLTGKQYVVSLKTEVDTKSATNKIKELWDTLTGKLQFAFVGGGKFGGRAKGGIYYPKLASGGIINQPGRGVPYHGAVIGERGAEAVVPLTDTAQMELLGESIGRHIKFNADITLELESRVLAKVMKEINNENKFARNGG